MRTGSWRRARAAERPAKPPPTITTRGGLIPGSIVLERGLSLDSMPWARLAPTPPRWLESTHDLLAALRRPGVLIRRRGIPSRPGLARPAVRAAHARQRRHLRLAAPPALPRGERGERG